MTLDTGGCSSKTPCVERYFLLLLSRGVIRDCNDRCGGADLANGCRSVGDGKTKSGKLAEDVLHRCWMSTEEALPCAGVYARAQLLSRTVGDL